MNDTVERMLVRYACRTPKDYENALKGSSRKSLCWDFPAATFSPMRLFTEGLRSVSFTAFRDTATISLFLWKAGMLRLIFPDTSPVWKKNCLPGQFTCLLRKRKNPRKTRYCQPSEKTMPYSIFWKLRQICPLLPECTVMPSSESEWKSTLIRRKAPVFSGQAV